MYKVTYSAYYQEFGDGNYRLSHSKSQFFTSLVDATKIICFWNSQGTVWKYTIDSFIKQEPPKT